MIYILKNGETCRLAAEFTREKHRRNADALARELQAIGPLRLNIKNEETCRLAGLTGEPLLFKGVVEKPPQGKNACGVFTVLARNTSLIPSRRARAPYRGRAGAHRERVEGEHPSIQTLFSQSRLTLGGYSG